MGDLELHTRVALQTTTIKTNQFKTVIVDISATILLLIL